MREDDYFQRWMHAREQLAEHFIFRERVLSAYRTVYENSTLDTTLLHLGQGSHHHVLSLGLSVSVEDIDVPVALKLAHTYPYTYDTFSYPFGVYFSSLLRAFELAALSSRYEPLAFIGVVTAKATIRGKTNQIAGLITEDVTDGKLWALEERSGQDACTVLLPERRRTLVVDPLMEGLSQPCEAPYLAIESRIDF